MSEEESNLVKHFKRELTLTGEDPEWIESMVEIAEVFSRMGHSGGSAFFAVKQLEQLLSFKNLTPLTDDPDEWIKHSPDEWDGVNEVWQNVRSGDCFSTDGGRTYYSVNDPDRKVQETVRISSND